VCFGYHSSVSEQVLSYRGLSGKEGLREAERLHALLFKASQVSRVDD
jgi:hypothetical protein